MSENEESARVSQERQSTDEPWACHGPSLEMQKGTESYARSRSEGEMLALIGQSVNSFSQEK